MTGTAHGASTRSCSESADYHRLDFWLGDWDVYVDGRLDGRNHIVSVLSGCAVQENWNDASGYDGKSWFYVDRATHRLKQVWLTSLAINAGGTKEKIEVPSAQPRSLRFQGTFQDSDGKRLFDRTTLMPEPDGTVHQMIQTSRDGRRWKIIYDAIYRQVQK